ncbi:NAD(P)-binding protein [Coniochaeta ligniaria NRRL 30616]|uniref:NAD(P)-binding protein n=1 Tax=Coniochaeta ligniaria NRRL 30616 TaxID=1408157 RepID=A0A1J7J838_9PEZI|nr:NAD(P)-binding protein [Coniochaeta ligniaria NRRL 30616]
MKSIIVTKFVENLSDLTVTTTPSPHPPPSIDPITILVKSTALNYVDILYARGNHQNNRSLVTPPFPLGLEFSGVVLSSPPSSPWPAGTPVFGEALGSFTTHLVLPFSPGLFSSSLHRVPAGWSFRDAAGVPATLPVSYGALVARGGLRTGETVLVHGAAGGLGVMAVQVALAAGAGRVFATASGGRRCAVVRGLSEIHPSYAGKVRCFDTAGGGRWWETIVTETGGRGVDVVFDSVGVVDLSLKCLAHRGRVLVVGFAGRGRGGMEGIKMNRVLLRQAQIIGYRYGESHRRWPEEKARIWKELWPLIEEGKIKPVVYDEVYKGLESVPRALKDLEDRKVWGKAVVQVDDEEEVPLARL